MPKKNYLDFSLFDEIGDAMDLFANTIRNAFEYDSLAGKSIFNAVVLTYPVPLNPSELEIFVPNRSVAEEDLDNPIPKFAFKARILGNNSPHLFLPNPCDLTTARELQKQQNIQDVIDMHTTVIAFDASAKPDLGDIVKIRVSPGTFSINVQTAEFVGIVTNQPQAIANVLKNETLECKKRLSNLFSGFSGGVVGNSLTDRGVSYTKHFDPDAPVLGFPVAGGDWGSAFGWRDLDKDGVFTWHNGTDVGAARGASVVAAVDGTVVGFRDTVMGEGPRAEGYSSGGNTITIKHKGKNGKTYYTLYMHLLEKDRTDGLPVGGGVLVTKGQKVTQGEEIGLVGNTGSSTGPHLHFELRGPNALGPGGQDGVGLNPVFHDERYFDDSIEALAQEKLGNIPQAPVEEAGEPMEGPDPEA